MATIPIVELLSTFPGESQFRHGVQGQHAAGSTEHGTRCVVQTGWLPAAWAQVWGAELAYFSLQAIPKLPQLLLLKNSFLFMHKAQFSHL